MRRFLTGPRRTPEPEPSPPITPASAASYSPYLEPPNDGTLRYKPLRGERSFRVLVLLPGSGDDEIACILDNVLLDDWLTHYEALSYMWGPPEPVFPISVDGGTSFVRKNLLNALKSLRLPTESRLLFIDALCINRGDVPERNRMVALMSQIYQRATKVLIWLGDGDEVSNVAFDKINQRLPWADHSAPLERATASTLTNLFNRPYWRRIWILQEILSGYNLEVYCGTKIAPWIHFIAVMRYIDAKVAQEPEEKEKEKSGVAFAKWCVATPGMTILRTQNGQTPEVRQHKLTQLIELCKKCESECYDIRDRIYGLVSLAMQDERGLKIEPDYSKTQAQLIIDTFLADFSKDNAHFRVSSQGSPPESSLSNGLLASQRSMQALLDEPLWENEKRAFHPLISIIDEPQSYLLRNSFSKSSIRGVSQITWTSEPLAANSSSKILFAHLEVDNMYKHRELRLPESIQKVKADVSKLTVRDYHSTEQLRVRYAWSPQTGCFRTESTYRHSCPPYFLAESTGECRLFITQNGTMGIAASAMEPLDILCAVEGAQDVFMVMRPRSDNNRIGFRLIGKAVLLKSEKDEKAIEEAQERLSGLGISTTAVGDAAAESPNGLLKAIDDAIVFTNDVAVGPEGIFIPFCCKVSLT